METPIISVITPCYNQAQYLPEALDSLLGQSYTNWECIIVNDGSKDNTEEVALAYCEKDNRFRYFSKENSGVCDTRNFAVAHSKGKYLLPLDADDKIGECYLEKAVDWFEKDEAVDAVYGKGVFFGELEGEIILKPFDYETLMLENVFYNSVIFRRSRFENIGGYNINMKNGWEDWELMISLLDEQSRVVKLPDLCYYYRILSGSRERSITDKQKESLFLQIYENHKETYDRHFPNPMRFAFFNRQLANKNLELQGNMASLRESKKYRLAQSIAKIEDLLMFWKTR